MTRRALTVLLATGALFAFSGSALAYWTAGGSGRGVAGTGTLAAPTVSVPATSGRSVTVHWGEVARVLAPGGSYFSQQVGAGSLRELIDFMMGPQEVGRARDPGAHGEGAHVSGPRCGPGPARS